MSTAAKPRAKRAPSEARLLAQPVPPSPPRDSILGGSDFAAVLGVGRITPVKLWQYKTGQLVPPPPSAALQRMFDSGKRLEPIVLSMLLEKLRSQGLTVELMARNQRYADAEHPFLSVEVDAELRLTGTITVNGVDVHLERELVNAELKTVRGFARRNWGDEETEDVPTDYAAQAMGGLMVAPGQRRLCVLGAMMGLDDVGLYWVRRDDETVAAMREKLISFWVDHVLTGTPPDLFKFSDVKDLYPLDNGRTVEATAEVAQAIEQLRRLRIDIRMKEADAERLALEVGEYAEAFTNITVGGRLAATFKTEERQSLDLAALRRQHPGLVELFERPTSTRVLRMKQRR